MLQRHLHEHRQRGGNSQIGFRAFLQWAQRQEAKKYKEALGLKSKTDIMDAFVRARMACEQYIKPWQPLSKILSDAPAYQPSRSQGRTNYRNQKSATRLKAWQDTNERNRENAYTTTDLLEHQKQKLKT